MWKTVGLTFSASSARTPPMPRTISCLMRSSVPAAVQPGGDVAVGRGVLREVGVEQVERDAADVRLPDFAEDRVVRQIDAHVHRRAVGVAASARREVVEVQLRIRFLLPAVGREVLLEVAVAIEQPDARPAAGPARWRSSDDRPPACPGRRSRSAAIRAGRTPPRNTRPAASTCPRDVRGTSPAPRGAS